MTEGMKPRELGDIRSRYEWKKIEAPKVWRPKTNGEELTGFYGGKTSRNGKFGQYWVVLIHIPRRGSFMLSGTRIIQLVDAANIEIGWPIRVVWLGLVKLHTAEDEEDKNMKNFDVFVAEGDPVSPDDLPKINDGVVST